MASLMPSRTQLGAMLRAMLAAYKRTLQATMAHVGLDGRGRSPQGRCPGSTTPDAAMAWGVALGLNSEIEAVLGRTVERQ